jgi:hypothetical protein
MITSFELENGRIFVDEDRLSSLGLTLRGLAHFLESQPFLFAAFTEDDVRRAASAFGADHATSTLKRPIQRATLPTHLGHDRTRSTSATATMRQHGLSLAERLHEESRYGSWYSGAVTFAVQHAQVGAPRAHGRPILVRHDSGDLVQVREVVSCPCR